MNMFARDIVALNHRLGKDAKPEPTEREKNKVIFLHVRPDASYHVEAWRIWNRIQEPSTGPSEFVRLHCRLAEVEVDDLLRRYNRRLHWFRRPLVRAVKARYPKLSSPQIGKLFNREYTTILYLLGTTQSAKRRGL
ncbi:hypothetical protein AB3480_00560 [Rhizobium mongolense]|uniref:hypothetical protein n=1 Tax=Rhizobium mongolense TaxID=57676 RepID=UPI0034A3B69B